MLNIRIPLQPEEKVMEESLQAFTESVLLDLGLLAAVFIVFVVFTKIIWDRWEP